MSRYAKAIAAVIVAAAGLAAAQFGANGIALGDDWPQLIGSVVGPFIVWRWPNDPGKPKANA